MARIDQRFLPSQAIRLGVEAQTVGFTAENGKLYVVNGTVNVQLPTPSASFHCVIKDLSGDIVNNPINIVRSGVENIDGVAANVAITSNNQSINLISDGVDWYIY